MKGHTGRPIMLRFGMFWPPNKRSECMGAEEAGRPNRWCDREEPGVSGHRTLHSDEVDELGQRAAPRVHDPPYPDTTNGTAIGLPPH